MVKTIISEKPSKLKRAVARLEEKLKVKIYINKNYFAISGKEYSEYISENILRALDFGFEMEDAFLLLDENYVVEYIDLKENTRRKNLKDVRARVIGRKGKAMKTIEELTGGVIVLNDNRLCIIVPSENLDVAVQSIISLIRGSKHGNVFAYLEKNRGAGDFLIKEDLGLTERAKKIGC